RDRQAPLHSTTIFVYNSWQRAPVCTRPVHGPPAGSARRTAARARLLCGSGGGRRPLRLPVPEANVLRQAAWHAAAATPRLPWTLLSSRSGLEETTVWPKDLASTFSARRRGPPRGGSP